MCGCNPSEIISQLFSYNFRISACLDFGNSNLKTTGVGIFKIILTIIFQDYTDIILSPIQFFSCDIKMIN